MPPKPGIEHLGHVRVRLRVRRQRRLAFSCWRSTRTASVRMPRSNSQQSNGAGTAPVAFCRNPMRSASASSLRSTAPPTTSVWPPRYFVEECTTTSAPSVERLLQVRRREGVVDHDAARRRRARRRRRAPMSTVASVGLVGDSHHTIAVSSVSARSSAAGSPRSTASNRRPASAWTRATRRKVPPYASWGITIRELGGQRAQHASSAASPLANAKPWLPPSSSASAASSTCARRVARPGVLEIADGRGRVALRVRRGKVNGRHDRAGRRIGFPPGVDCSWSRSESLTRVRCTRKSSRSDRVRMPTGWPPSSTSDRGRRLEPLHCVLDRSRRSRASVAAGSSRPRGARRAPPDP